MHDALPILCAACGAPVDAPVDVAFHCPYCGTRDELPRVAHARVRELRRRIHARTAAVLQLSERHATFVRIFEGNARGIYLPYALMGALMLVQSLSVLTVPGGGPRSLLSSLLNMLPLIAIPGAGLLGLAYGRRIYRAEVRDLLYAGPSRVPGGPARCRCCGGSLPLEHGPLLRCRHCHTHSIVAPAAQARSAAVLTAEVRDHRGRLERASSRMVAIGRSMDAIFYVGMPLGLIVTILLANQLGWILG
jgi:predicted RNA-binding Zn-ribbon protein involved in translation (DUF1610 family)